MPKTSEMLTSKFMKQEDVGRGLLLTIADVERKNVAKEGADAELKWCLTFKEEDKPMTLNSTNIQLCQQIFGSDDTDKWKGKQVVLYVDPTIMFQGKVTGGIRVRKPKATAPPPPPPPSVEPLTDDDIPF